jgi:hypothetical protein
MTHEEVLTIIAGAAEAEQLLDRHRFDIDADAEAALRDRLTRWKLNHLPKLERILKLMPPVALH